MRIYFKNQVSNNNIVPQDFFEKLTIKFDNKQPVEVVGFLKSINAFQKEYRNICKENNINCNDDEVKLYIQVREGCIEWDFIRHIVKEYPLLATAGTSIFLPASIYLIKTAADVIIEKVIKKIINGDKPETENKNTIANARDFLAVQKNDTGSNLSMTYTDNNNTQTTFNNCVFNGITARGVIDTLDEIITKDKEQISDFTNEILQLTCNAGNQIKGIINEVDKNAKVIIFNPKELQNNLIINNDVNPLSIYYIVNGKIKRTKDNKILAYIIEELVETIKD